MSRLTDEQTMQVRINTAVAEALSANNAKWREKIEEYFRVPEWDYSEREIVISVDDWQSILSEMGKEGE